MELTAEEYAAITGEPAPEDFLPCLTLAQSMLDARTLCFYAGRSAETLPGMIRRTLGRYLAYQTQAVSLAGGVAAAAEAPAQSESLGKFSIASGVGTGAHCPAAAALLPLLISYAQCE
ncbi:MAG: hypothetical protein LLF96_13180 [Eubacteriales bacterium]|nr:hypothetical protein [Eubacteriales bacterium]